MAKYYMIQYARVAACLMHRHEDKNSWNLPDNRLPARKWIHARYALPGRYWGCLMLAATPLLKSSGAMSANVNAVQTRVRNADTDE
ncbi:hypothetical protein [Chitinophaga nivalis]|uniref:Uncharacterized protein n=1 Tax=Chitinophaga nivalis TaxID=2991709 RepID=A0ABT3IJJ8_9BACT|nr:hypothetical protein [Chitinophaga nivalis]MCW3466176.1 hypothetical protein [Chitinophaga nivalis]MCW3484133.1 hypothetical protein [Chitinophaga nivalis]